MEAAGIITDRHCAFCLKSISGKEVKQCAKCHRRAYCGKECQKKDWKKKTNSARKGQGHDDWCGLLTCEEDLDWSLKSEQGGKGVIAKRLIRQGERIVVHGVKFNGIGPKMAGDWCPDLGRADTMLFNHSCEANAANYNDRDYKVVIIYAEKDIPSGAEITLNYTDFSKYFADAVIPVEGGERRIVNSFENCRHILKLTYGISCPSDCFCHDKQKEELILKCKATYKGLSMFHPENYPPDFAHLKNGIDLAILEDLMAKHGEMGACRWAKAQLLTLALNVLQKSFEIPDVPTKIKYHKYKDEAMEISRSIFHPKSKCCEDFSVAMMVPPTQ